MRKKRVLLFLVLAVLAFGQVHAASNLNTNSAESDAVLFADTAEGMPAYSKNTALIDLPLSGGLAQFAVAIYDVTGTVIWLITIFAFLCIVFNAFKLWAGTMEIKKVYVDIIYKFMMCIILLHLYIPVTDKLMQVATHMGAVVSGGYKKIDRVFVEAYKALTDDIQKGLQEYKEYLLTEIFKMDAEGKSAKTKDGKTIVSADVIANLKNFGMTPEQAKKWAEENQLVIAHAGYLADKSRGGSGEFYSTRESMGYTSDANSAIKCWVDSDGNILSDGSGGFSKAVTKANSQALKNFDSKKQTTFINKLTSLMTVLAENPLDAVKGNEEDDNDGVYTSDGEDIYIGEKLKKNADTAYSAMKSMMLSPYLKDKNDKDTLFLSPSRLIRTCTLFSDAIAYSTAYQIDEHDGDIKDVVLNPDGKWGFKGIFAALQGLLFKLGMIICVVVVMAEYTITLLEFYLIRALATLLIPMLFVDSLKSYAQNILKIFIQYFFKVMVIVMATFFALGLFLDVEVVIYKNFDAGDAQTLVLYLSTLVTGLLFALNAAKITNTLLSGQPSLGVGEIAHGMRAALNGAHQVGVAGHNFHRGVSAAGSAVRAGGQNLASFGSTAMEAGRTGRAAAQARAAELRGQTKWDNLTPEEKATAEKMIDREARAAGRDAGWAAFGSAAGQKIKQGLYKAATGRDMQFFDKDGNRDSSKQALTVGQKFWDDVNKTERTATLDDVRKHNNQRMNDEANNVLARRREKVNFGDKLSKALQHPDTAPGE